MIVGVYSVYDAAVKAYLPTFVSRTDAEAQRSFVEAVADPKHQFSKHASDYTLFRLAVFDDVTGEFKAEIDKIVSALSVVPVQ
ncbi:MAG: nonstructural protein [Microviridae sp.]|nr:MAG: nonstructural protein [Microviridae sp.]